MMATPEALTSKAVPHRVARPLEAGFAAEIAERLDMGIRSGLLRDLHAVLVMRCGLLVLERYDTGGDASWGRDLGNVIHGPDTLHDLRSVTKSIVGLLYGIALERGLVPELDRPLLGAFPAYDDLPEDPRRQAMLVRHALTMTLGLEWDETRPYTDPLNSEIAMEHAPDRCRFVLERAMTEEPGSSWTYSGGAVALLGSIIARGTGRSLPDFAREALFEPLGITHFEWICGRDGVASAASGLRMRADDLVKIGAMILSEGLWDGRRVVAADWLKASFTPAIRTSDGLEYGYLWFLGEAFVPAFGGPKSWAAGFGNGGQRLWLMPDADLAVVIFSGNYDDPDSWITPTRVWRELVLANFNDLGTSGHRPIRTDGQPLAK